MVVDDDGRLLDQRTATIDGPAGSYVIWSQFVPWHNPLYLVGNRQDMALTGAIRVME